MASHSESARLLRLPQKEIGQNTLKGSRTGGSLTALPWRTVHCPTWTWTPNWVKSPAEMKACVNYICDPFEAQLQEKSRLQVSPATSLNIPWLLELQNETCLSDIGCCGDTGTGVASDPGADTSAKTLSVLIWIRVPWTQAIIAFLWDIHTELTDMPWDL